MIPTLHARCGMETMFYVVSKSFIFIVINISKFTIMFYWLPYFYLSFEFIGV